MRIAVLVAIAAVTAGALAGAAPAAAATPAVTVPAIAPPKSVITVTLAGFGPSEAADVYVDTTDLTLVVTSATGAWTGPITLPSTAGAGAHTVTAVGRHSGVSAQTTITLRSDWPQQQFGPDHAGESPYESILSTANVPRLRQRWALLDSSAADSPGSPTVVGGVVYAVFGTLLRAITARSGALRWSTTVGAVAGDSRGSVAVVSGTAYVAENDDVIAVNANTGAVKWDRTVSTNDLLGGLVVVGGLVFTTSLDGTVSALNATTGAIDWQVTVSGDPTNTPTVVGGLVYVATSTTVYALAAATGTVRWQAAASGNGTYGPLVVVDGTVLCSCGGVVTAYRASTGAVGWSNDVHALIYGAMAVADGLLLVGDVSGDVIAYRATTGAVVWTTRASPIATGMTGSIVVANGVVYAGGRSTTAMLDLATGAVLGDLGVGVYYGGPVVVDGAVYTKDAVDAGLYRYDLPS